MQLFDMHCHLDFAENAKDIAAVSAAANITALNSTVNPSGYVIAHEKFAEHPNLYVALGLHPWWVANNQISEVDVARFEDLAKDALFIGEIGLDFHGKRKESKARQEEIFYRALQACNGADTGAVSFSNADARAGEDTSGNKLIFIHAVDATTRVLDMLDQCNIFDNHTVVFHWFQGSKEELDRALKAGALFSVSARMLANDRTRALAKDIPDDRLLLETDSPAQVGMLFSIDTWHKELESALMDLAELRQASPQNLAELLAANSQKLLD